MCKSVPWQHLNKVLHFVCEFRPPPPPAARPSMPWMPSARCSPSPRAPCSPITALSSKATSTAASRRVASPTGGPPPGPRTGTPMWNGSTARSRPRSRMILRPSCLRPGRPVIGNWRPGCWPITPSCLTIAFSANLRDHACFTPTTRAPKVVDPYRLLTDQTPVC